LPSGAWEKKPTLWFIEDGNGQLSIINGELSTSLKIRAGNSGSGITVSVAISSTGVVSTGDSCTNSCLYSSAKTFVSSFSHEKNARASTPRAMKEMR